MRRNRVYESYRRGQVVFADLGYSDEGVQGGIRPCVVVSCDKSNHFRSPHITVCPLTSYAKRGGDKLIGRSLLDCHNPESRDRIQQVVDWFAADESYNIVYTFHNEKQNKDVYMVALRDEGKLIGYYEKHEYRNSETMKPYDLW